MADLSGSSKLILMLLFIADIADHSGPMLMKWEGQWGNTPPIRAPRHIQRALHMTGAREILQHPHPGNKVIIFPNAFFPTSILLSSPLVTEDCYKKTPQWMRLNYEAEQVKKMDQQWLAVDDEVDHLPSTPPYLLTSSDYNMSGNKSTNLLFGSPKGETILI